MSVKKPERDLAAWALEFRELNLSADSAYIQELIEEGEEHLRFLEEEEETAAESVAAKIRSLKTRLTKGEELLEQRLRLETEQPSLRERQDP